MSDAELLLARTKHGELRHITEDRVRTLCGRQVDSLPVDWQEGKVIPWAPHWSNGATMGGAMTCSHCEESLAKKS
jgi:hypothetical protein